MSFKQEQLLLFWTELQYSRYSRYCTEDAAEARRENIGVALLINKF